MRDWADFTLENNEGGEAVLALVGPLCVFSIGDLDARLDALGQPFSRLDLSRVTQVDTAGAWLAWRVAHDAGAEIDGASDDARRLIAAVTTERDFGVEPPPRPGAFTRIAEGMGIFVLGMGHGLVQVVDFLGAMIIAAGRLLRHPSRFPIKALVHQMELVGVNALLIVGLMSFLIGIVIAQQGAIQLQEFGAEIYTINLTGRLSMRELGILMTAIMVAGRSGSSFAAQIGTMRLTEEVDAMRTIGVSPMEALVIPRVLAAMLMLPLLGFYSAVVSVIGGAFISTFAIGIPFMTFLSRIQEVVPLYDLWVGLIKAPVFGFIIAVSGCYHGMQVKGNSEEVGLRTTMAVVAAIFMVIVLDAFFAVFFTELGWG